MNWFERKGDAVIHGVRLKIRGGTQSLPAPLIGAYVTAYSLADNPRDAVVQSVKALRAMGYDFEDVLPEGLSMPLSGWSAHISSAWSDFPGHFPSQEQIAARLENQGVVFSPFAGFEA